MKTIFHTPKEFYEKLNNSEQSKNLKSYLFFIIFSFLFSNNIVFAEKSGYNIYTFGGVIKENTIWNFDKVLVSSNIIIEDGVTLFIESGTTVEFIGHYKIEVQGCILAQGTADSPISFIPSQRTQNSSWGGIRFNNTSNLNNFSKFSFCQFSKANALLNRNDTLGGAFYLNNYSNLIIENSVIKNCVAYNGGALYCDNSSITFTSNKITNNKAVFSGGICLFNNSNCILVNNTISDNISEKNGGGITILLNCKPLLINNKILRNSTRYSGGGIYCNNNCKMLLYNNIINFNTSQNGGGIELSNSEAEIINSNICYNESENGGGIFCINSSPNISNTIIWGNKTIIQGNTLVIFFTQSKPVLRNNIIEGGLESIVLIGGALMEAENFTDNMNADPAFEIGHEGNYRLSEKSPCLDKGNEDVNFNYLVTDIDGNPRIKYDAIDIGAYEFYQKKITNESSGENTNH